MADVKWIKIYTDIFNNKKIKQIEVMPEGDAIIVIWLKLLCLAGNINDNGQIYLTNEVPYTEQMLSVEFGRPLTTIQLALKVFEQFGMVEIIDNILLVSNWEKYQNIEGMEKIREQTRKRVAKHREKQALLTEKNECNVTDRYIVTLRNATDKDIDIDKEIDKDNNIVVFFESVWKLYPRKEGKSAISKSQKKKLYKLGYEKLSKAIIKYADEVKGRDKQYILMGSTFFNGRYEDYLDDDVASEVVTDPSMEGWQ